MRTIGDNSSQYGAQLDAEPHFIKRKWDVEVALLRRAFSELPADGVLSYGDMSKLCQIPITCAHSALKRAMRDAVRHDNVCLVAVRNVGYRRLSDGATVRDGARSAKKVMRAAKRGRTKLKAARDERLHQAERLEKMARVAVFSAIATTTHGNSMQARIEKRASAVDDYLQGFKRSLIKA